MLYPGPYDYFISDTHFGHKAIIDLCYRPFTDVEEMAETLIENFNNKVRRDDSPILWLGDVFFCNKQKSIEILARLKGKHTLVSGNHDGSASRMMDIGFETVVEDCIYFRMGDFKFRACHFPYFNKNSKNTRYSDLHPRKKGEDFLLHGHTHNMSKTSSTMIHCGVDAWDFVPVSAKEIMNLAHKIRGEK